ncbi:MAG: N-acetylneuraminate synthase family protein [Bacteroidota bacterium]|nr:N-acetylneuraminate synthase family protein [Bacteroidota bacterium]
MTYIIGEIGQNHNGNVEIAKKIIDVVAKPVIDKLFDIQLPKMDAVKLTKRDLSYELSDSQMRRPYINKNSFAKTYGEHRAFLELNDEEHFEIYSYAKSENLDFVETLCAPSCLSMLKLFQPDKLKVASRDLTNLPLLQALAETNIPIIVSTGMASDKELDEAIEIISKYHNDISILHCVSQYPTEPKNVNLNTITYLIEKYSDYTIGYSDHTIGIAVPTAAVSMGAKIIEKHITLDRNMKGTDQIGSLGPDGIFRMVRDLRLLEMSFGKKEIFISDDVKLARLKLERSIATNKRLYKGNIITENDIHLLSPGDGYKWSEKEQLRGKRVNCDIPKNELIYSNMLV